jgi:hypothetical protein
MRRAPGSSARGVTGKQIFLLSARRRLVIRSKSRFEKGIIMRKLLIVLSIVCSVAGCASPGMTGSGTSGYENPQSFDSMYQGG